MITQIPFEISDLRTFLAAAESSNFKEAARVLGMTPSGVTQSITNLENKLGTELFDHTRRPIRLTQKGEHFYQQARRIWEIAERLTESLLREDDHQLFLRISLSESVYSSLGPWVAVAASNRDGGIGIVPMSASHLVRAFEEGEIDVCVSPELHAATSIAYQTSVWSEKYLLVVPKGAIATCPSATQYMQNNTYIRLQTKDFDRRQTDRIIRSLGITTPKEITVGTSRTMMGCVAQNIGWALMPPLSIASGLDFFESVDVIELDGVSAERTQYVSARQTSLTAVADHLKETLLGTFDEHMRERLLKTDPKLIKAMTIYR